MSTGRQAVWRRAVDMMGELYEISLRRIANTPEYSDSRMDELMAQVVAPAAFALVNAAKMSPDISRLCWSFARRLATDIGTERLGIPVTPAHRGEMPSA